MDSATQTEAASKPEANIVKVWSAPTIAIITVFLGFPSGGVLALVNARRMGLRNRQRTYWITLILFSIAFLFPHPIEARLFVGLVLGIYLGIDSHRALADFETNGNQIRFASWYTGIFLGIGILLTFFAIISLISSVLTIVLGVD